LKQNYLKALSLKACESLNQISTEATHAAKQSRCGEFLHYAVNASDLSMKLNRANFCHQRTCPLCCWLRSAKWRIRIFQGLPGLLRDYPNYPFLFLTLTAKNCHIGELRSHVRMMEKGWSRLSNLQCFPAIGYLKAVEVTRPRDCFYAGHFVGRMGQSLINRWINHLKKQPNWNPRLWREYYCEECHPHMHILMMVSPSYFEAEEYINHSRWQFLWRRSARLEYSPVVDIRRVDELTNAIFETSKYCLKSNDMVDVLGCLTVRQLHGLRLLSVGGAFNDYFSQRAIDAIAATGELGTEQYQEGIPCWYEWNGKKYDLVRLADIYREIEPE
jgi:plasmid rolling circle replication initiator protein Rep